MCEWAWKSAASYDKLSPPTCMNLLFHVAKPLQWFSRALFKSFWTSSGMELLTHLLHFSEVQSYSPRSAPAITLRFCRFSVDRTCLSNSFAWAVAEWSWLVFVCFFAMNLCQKKLVIVFNAYDLTSRTIPRESTVMPVLGLELLFFFFCVQWF